MNDTIDIVATTNPAYCSLVLMSFVGAYTEVAGTEPHVSLSYLAVPMTMSSAINRRFKGTNARTGLLAWINRNPELRLDLPEVLRQAVPIVRAAVIFGLQAGLFELTPEGGMRVRSDHVGGRPKDPPRADYTRKHHSAAHSFGAWCGGVRSTSIIFMSLGVMP